MAIKGKGERNVPRKGLWIGTYEADRQMRKIITEMLDAARKNGKDRATVAKEMDEALGRSVTPAMLAEFTRSAVQPREGNGEKAQGQKRYLSLPAPWVRALSTATGSDKLVRYLMDGSNLALLELAERQHLKFEWVIDRLERLYKKLRNANPQGQRSKRLRGARKQ